MNGKVVGFSAWKSDRRYLIRKLLLLSLPRGCDAMIKSIVPARKEGLVSRLDHFTVQCCVPLFDCIAVLRET